MIIALIRGLFAQLTFTKADKRVSIAVNGTIIKRT
jgi:hypothetical protein